MNLSASANSSHPMIDWAILNIGRGCDHNGMVKTMIDSGLNWRDAHQFMEAAQQRVATASNPQQMPSPRAELFSSAGCPDGQATRVAMHIANPEIAVISNMLSESECSALIELGRSRLMHSMTVDDDAPQSQQVHPDRSSEGAALNDVIHPAIAAVRARASWMFNWPEENFEGLQILRYLPGQEYKPHHDWFDPAKRGGVAQLSYGGQRLATAIVYLNDCPKGGSTTIPALGVRTAPIRGSAIFFSYTSDHSMVGDPRLLHAGEPVEAGEKWVCTLWMRQNRFVSP